MQCHHRKKPKKKKLRKTTENAECWIMSRPYAWTNRNSCKILDLSSHNANSTIITGIQLQYSTFVELWTVIHGKTKALWTHRSNSFGKVHSVENNSRRLSKTQELISFLKCFLSFFPISSKWMTTLRVLIHMPWLKICPKMNVTQYSKPQTLKWTWYSTLTPYQQIVDWEKITKMPFLQVTATIWLREDEHSSVQQMNLIQQEKQGSVPK